MKKIFALVLALMMLLSLAACGTDTNDSPAVTNDVRTTDKTNQIPAEQTSPPAAENNVLKYPLPELKPDGTTSVDLDSEQVIYDRNGIKVTYKGYAHGTFGGYALNVVVENNATENLRFFPYAAVWNGMTVNASSSIHDEPMAKGETRECAVYISHDDNKIESVLMGQELKCFELHFGFYDGANVYGSPMTLIDNHVVYSFTQGEHDHRNDQRAVMGELIYESDEIAIYLEKTFNEEDDDYYSNATVINKTNRTVMIDSSIECRYTVAPPRPHYDSLFGFSGLIAPNSYRTGEVYIDEEWSGLEMTEIIFKKQCYYATYIDSTIHEDDYIDAEGHDGLEKTNCFYDQITVPVTVNKYQG